LSELNNSREGRRECIVEEELSLTNVEFGMQLEGVVLTEENDHDIICLQKAMQNTVVLVIEDSNNSRLKKDIVGFGLNPVVSGSMTEALSEIRHRRFAAIFIDSETSSVDSLEAVLNVRDLDTRVPIFVTGDLPNRRYEQLLMSRRAVFLFPQLDSDSEPEVMRIIERLSAA
jgi:CheY-like chemotaxis protein